jgi:LL-H family phage holin
MEANPFLSELATTFVIALVPVVIGAIGWIARAVVAEIKSRTNAAHYAILRQLASAAVRASEQTLKGKAGQEKLAAAKAVVTSALLAKGIRLDESEIATAIESAVFIEKGVWVDLPDAEVPAPEVTLTVDGESAF